MVFAFTGMSFRVGRVFVPAATGYAIDNRANDCDEVDERGVAPRRWHARFARA